MSGLQKQTIADKIVSMDELRDRVQKAKAAGSSVVQCHGNFDLYHPGQIRHLQTARALGDLLVVTIPADNFVEKAPGRLFFNERLRAESLVALQSVDYVAVLHLPSVTEAIRKVCPSVFVHGNDIEQIELNEVQEAISQVGGRLAFTEDLNFSSTALLNSHFPVFSDETSLFLRSFRKQYSIDDILACVKRFSDMSVLVIGDTIVDEYHFCTAVGKSSKSANIVAQFHNAERYAGGAFAIAKHVSNFSKNVQVVTCLGKQPSHEDFLRAAVSQNIEPVIFHRDDSPTVVKRRFVDPFMMTKMFEVCYLNDNELTPDLQAEIYEHVEQTISQFDVVIACDFGHGFFAKQIRELICSKSRFLALNVQTNSQNFGFNMVTKYPHADYVCIDENEIRLAAHSKYGELKTIGREVADQLQTEYLTVTSGGHGSSTFTRNGQFTNVPVFGTEIVDTVGAGDAYLSISSLCAACHEPSEVVGFLGNAAGALAVRIIGNKESVRADNLSRFMRTLLT